MFTGIFTLPAAAADWDEETAQLEALGYEGYIVKLAENALPVSVMSAASASFGAWAGAGDYLVVDSLEEAEEIPSEYVRYIEPNYIITLFDPILPDDPLYERNQWNLRQIGMESAFALGLNGEGVKIGFVDSGIYSGHEDLETELIDGANFAGDDSSYSSDLTGHGTFAAGIVAAQTGNGKGISGIAPKAEIKAYRAFKEKTTTVAAVVDAINRAIDDRCQILNLSLGSTSSPQLLKEAIDNAEAAGMVIVAAVGNNGSGVVNYPAAYTGVIGVGSVDSSLTRSSFSQKNSTVYVTAPGEGVYSLNTAEDEKYVSGSGTSYAVPVVTGMAALALGYDNDITEDGIRYLLKESATDKGAIGYDHEYGYGVVNIEDFVVELTRSFIITYELNGGELPEGAKSSYNVTDETFVLSAPTQEGYAFAGWYEASDLSGAKTNEIKAGSLGERKFFASWASEDSVALASVAVDGHGAVWQEEEGGYYRAYVTYGTDLHTLTNGHIAATPAAQGSEVNIVKSAGDDSGAAWTITVTSGTTSKEYKLHIEIMQLHVAAGKGTQTGEAYPAPLDGSTEAVKYEEDSRQWFVNGDGLDGLPVDFACAVELESGNGTAAVAVDGVTISYIPAPEDAGEEVRLLIWGVSGGVRSLDRVTLTISVEALPESQSVKESPTFFFDRYTQEKVEITLVLYGNQVTGVSIGDKALTAQEYSLSEITADGRSVLTLAEGTVLSLDEGEHTVVITLSDGNPCSVTLTIADSAPRYTVTFTDRGQIHRKLENVREGSTVAMPPEPVRTDYIFGGWYTADNVRFTSVTKVMKNLELSAKWDVSGGGGIPPGDGGGGGGGGALPPQGVPAMPAANDVLAIPDMNAVPNIPVEDGNVHENAPESENPFTDVSTADWFYEDVQFAVKNGLLNGTGDNTFSPNTPLSRAMLVTIIYRLHHQNTQGMAGDSSFADVPQGAYYSTAVAWAAGADIVTGYDDKHFGPDEPITRQDLAAVLMRYIRMVGTDYMITQDYIFFADENEIDNYAKDAIQTLHKLGVLNGTGENRVAPKGNATRAQAAAMLRRFVEKIQRQ